MNQSQRERLVLVLSKAMQAALTDSPERVRQALEESLRELGEPERTAPRQGRRVGTATRERAVESAYEAPFNEAESRKQVVGFLDVIVMASGTLGRRTADRLLERVFGERARSAERWLLQQGLVLPSEDEALQVTEEGLRYLDRHRETKHKSYVGFEPEAARRGF